MYTWLVGIDEAGRGPLAGPVAVGLCALPYGSLLTGLDGLTDSKRVPPIRRVALARECARRRARGELYCTTSLVSAATINERGITHAVTLGVRRVLARFVRCTGCAPAAAYVQLDGGLSAPARYRAQATIVRGDISEPVISAASVCAKVARDRYMERRAAEARFAPYDFAVHKGYGTRAHRAAIATHGLSAEHRVHYCRNIRIR